MRRILVFFLVAATITVVCITACKRTQTVVAVVSPAIVNSNYPTAIANIFINKCAIAGCHDAASGPNADGLVMDTWAHLFNGAYDGAMVVPYCTTFSPLLAFININIANGDTAQPTMPISTTSAPQSPLSQAEYDTISNWIARGAPDKNGNVAFATNPSSRQKLYMVQTGCNQVAVIDGQTKLVMRYIPVGDDADKAQHDIKVSSDGLYAYVTFYEGNIIQKIDCTKDTVVATLNLSSGLVAGQLGQWSIILLSPDNSTLLVSAFQTSGYIVAINTATMQVIPGLSLGWDQTGLGSIRYPHGLASNAAFDTFYTAIEFGNEIVKWWFESGRPKLQTIPINNYAPTYSSITGVTPDPHLVMMSPDYSKYYVTCQGTNEVRVLSTATDKVIDSIPVGAYPQEMAFDTVNNHLFVTCYQDRENPNYGTLGSVYVIDYNTDVVVKKIYGFFYEPHDAAVDYLDGNLYVASTNLDTVAGQPPAHHTTICGVPGWYTVYNLNTLNLADNNIYYVLTDPYSVAARYK